MGGLLVALNAGKTSLSTNQKAIEIAGNNIANVNTPGYSRQKPVLTPYPSINFAGFFIGQGVKISDIQREHDVFLAKQLQQKNQLLGEESAKTGPLAELERIFSVSEDSLATEIDRFFDAWQELTANPNGEVERDIVIQRGNLLGDVFRSAAEELDSARKNIDSSLVSKVDGVNLKLKELADLNERIAGVEISGQTANTFRDRRDVLLEELSFSLGATSYEEGGGMVSVQLPGGVPLVLGNKALPLETVQVQGFTQLQTHLGDTVLSLPLEKLGGEFHSLLELRDRFIPSLQSDLDQLAYNLANAVNAQHQAGVGRDGSSNPFFAPFDPDPLLGQPDAARNLVVSLQDASQVAAGSTNAPGDNRNALLLAELGRNKIINGEDTFGTFYGKITSKVGMESGQNRLSLGGAEDAMTQLRNLRDGKVGVSLEEEMIDLIQYQKGFEASAKFLSTIDEMMDMLLSLKR